MGCSASKLDYEEAVQLCRDRKNFIKQAIEQRNRFASCHIAYIQSLLRVSAALIQYFEADDHHEFFFDSYINHPSTSTEKLNPETSGVPRKFLKPAKNKPKKGTSNIAAYIRSCRNPSDSVEEEREPEETMRVESYGPMNHYGINGSSDFHASPANQSSFFSSLNNTTRHGTPSSRAPQSDHFWNPFSSLDRYGYPTGSSIEEAKLLLFSASGATPPKPPSAAKSLEAELRNWRHCLTDWIHSQRSYAGALSGWVYRCAPRETDDAAADAAAGRELPSVFGVCVRWYRMLESVSEARAVEGMEFFTAGMASVSAHQREAARATAAPPTEAAKEAERVAKEGPRVVCAGMSVAVGSLAEFAVGAAEGYDALVRRWRREARMREAWECNLEGR